MDAAGTITRHRGSRCRCPALAWRGGQGREGRQGLGGAAGSEWSGRLLWPSEGMSTTLAPRLISSFSDADGRLMLG